MFNLILKSTVLGAKTNKKEYGDENLSQCLEVGNYTARSISSIKASETPNFVVLEIQTFR